MQNTTMEPNAVQIKAAILLVQLFFSQRMDQASAHSYITRTIATGCGEYTTRWSGDSNVDFQFDLAASSDGEAIVVGNSDLDAAIHEAIDWYRSSPEYIEVDKVLCNAACLYIVDHFSITSL